MKKYIILFLFLIALPAFAIWLLGIGFFKIETDKGAYWPDVGYGICHIRVWHNADIIYSDSYSFHLNDSDSVLQTHIKMADDFIRKQKGSK